MEEQNQQQSIQQPEKPHKKRNLILLVIAIGFIIAGIIGGKVNGELGLLAVSVFPIALIMNAIEDLRKPVKRKFSRYMIIIFSVLVIAILVAAVVSQLGNVHTSSLDIINNN